MELSKMLTRFWCGGHGLGGGTRRKGEGAWSAGGGGRGGKQGAGGERR